MGGSGKVLVKDLALKIKARLKKYKKAKYAIRNVSWKDISKIIKEFEKFEKLPYEKKRPKHEPTESYFHLAREIAKCMVRSDKLNWYNHGSYKEMNAQSSNVIVTNESESKRSIVNERLSQNCSAKENELCFTKEDKSEYANEKQKYAKNEVACNMTNYSNVSNVYERGRNNSDMSCERACMDTEDNEYFSDIFDTLTEYLDLQGLRLSSKNLREAVLRVMV